MPNKQPLARSRVVLLAALLGALPFTSCAAPKIAPTEIPAATMEDFVGTWDVSLYFDPTQPPSSTVMEIRSVEAGTPAGTFYGTDFSEARATQFEGEVIFSLVTSDGTGPYLTSGRLRGGTITGQTYSTGRGFLMPWSAVRRQ